MSKKNLLSLTLSNLKKTASRHAKDFAEGRAAHAVLAPFADADAAVAALAPSSGLSLDERGLILAAMVIEHQRTGRPLWAVLLTGAFEGALLNLRARLGRKVSPDLDQRVLLGFVSAISSPFVAASGRHANIAIFRATKRIVFGETLAEREEPKAGKHDDDKYVPDSRCVDDEPREDALATEIERAFASLGDPEEVSDLLHATYVVGEPLTEYVDRTHPELDAAARASLYEKLRNKRYAAVRRLRACSQFRALAGCDAERSSGNAA